MSQIAKHISRQVAIVLQNDVDRFNLVGCKVLGISERQLINYKLLPVKLIYLGDYRPVCPSFYATLKQWLLIPNKVPCMRIV